MNEYSEIFERSFREQLSLASSPDMVIDQWSGPQKEGCPCPDCIEKNSFRDDIYVVIQGHTEQIGEIFGNYRGYKNIVWALDDTESMRDYALMAKTRINPVVVKRPINPGFGNINLQSVSTVAGLKHAKKLGAKYCIKIRSDMVFSPLHKFINKADFSRLGFLAYVTTPYADFEKPMETFSQYIEQFIAHHNIENKDNITKNYMMDFCAIGPVDQLISFFDHTEFPNTPPDVDGEYNYIPTPGELKYLLNYLQKEGHEIDTRKESLKKIFNLFLPVLEENDIDLISIKNDYSNYSKLRQKANWYLEA